MKKVLLITGDLACGKTTFSKILSTRYGFEVFNKDSVKEVLADNIGFSNREENKKLSDATVAVMIHIFEVMAPFGRDLILEANFHKSEIDRIASIASANQYELLVLNLFASKEVSFERFRNRNLNEDRHPAHLTAGLDSFEAFSDCIDASRKELETVSKVDVDSTSFAYQTDEELLAKLDSFFK